jgi:hypothetical protein
MITNQYVREVQLKHDEVPSFKEYPFSLPAIRHLHSPEFPGNNLSHCVNLFPSASSNQSKSHTLRRVYEQNEGFNIGERGFCDRRDGRGADGRNS